MGKGDTEIKIKIKIKTLKHLTLTLTLNLISLFLLVLTLALIFLFILDDGGWANPPRAVVVERIFDFGDVRGEAAQFARVHADALADQFQTAADVGAIAMTVVGDACHAQFFHAIKAKDGEERRRGHRFFDVEFADEGKDASPFIHISWFWLRGEAGEEFAGNVFGMEGAALGEDNMGVEWKKTGAVVLENGQAVGIEKIGGGRKEQEALA